MSALDYVIFALAAWRLASLLVNEDGPASVFARLRKWAGISTVAVRQEDGSLQVGKTARTSLAEGLMCVWCVSVWMAALLVFGHWVLARDGFLFLHGVFDGTVAILAVSASAIGWHEVIERVRK